MVSVVGVVTTVTSAIMGAVVSVVVLSVELSMVVVVTEFSVYSSFSSLQEIMVRLKQVNAKKAAM